MFVYPSDSPPRCARPGSWGSRATAPQADWPAIRDRIFGRIDPISAGGSQYRASGTQNATLYEAHAEFSGDRGR